MVFFRKYRPQTIEELDSKLVRETLSNILSQDSVPHAFLFTGPKGLGKTSTARIAAKVLNCTAKRKKGNIEPCNKCEQCISITNGANLDILEIDGASNRGIDEIRDLRDKVRLLPSSARKKVYIIDEVHMLTTEAFNALLKTLEEPPPHVAFILCTTEPHKIPPTIISRCTHITFPLADEEDLVRSLTRIAKGEKLDANKETLYSIAKLSEGSFRDGAKILEELVAFSKNKKITEELVNKKYNITGISSSIREIIEILTRKDAKRGIELVSRMIEQGVDIKYFIEQLINELHGQLLQEVGVKGSVSSIKYQVLSIEDIKELIRLLTKAHGELKYAVLPQLPVELVIIEWSEAQKNAEQDAEKRGKDIQFQKDDDDSDIEMWNKLIKVVKSHNHSIAGVLRGCKLKNYDGKDMVIETGYKFHKDRLSEEKTAQLIEKVMQEIAGKKINISILLRR